MLYFPAVVTTQAEHDLWLAVVQRAIYDLAANESNIKRGAHAWFLSHSRHVGSFIWVCHHFELDPAAVRRKLERRISDRAA